MAEPADLLDEDGAPTREGRGRVSGLLADKPRYAKWIGGDVGQGARPIEPHGELWGRSQSRTHELRCR